MQYGKIRQDRKERIRENLSSLCKKQGYLRKRLLSIGILYAKHAQFMEKLTKLDETGLAKALKRLKLSNTNESLPVLEKMNR